MIRALKKIDVTLDKVSDNLTSRRITRGQLSRFSEHHAHISMVEPKTFFKLLKIMIGLKLCVKNSIISSAIKFGN